MNALPARDHDALLRWWATLPKRQRTELHRRWDPRGEDIQWQAEGTGWQALPIRLQGRTVEDAELGPEGRLAKRQLLEFVLNHEEIRFFLEERRFHICRRHAPAREVLAAGVLPARFRCAFRGEACPLRAISREADERPVLIQLRFAR